MKSVSTALKPLNPWKGGIDELRTMTDDMDKNVQRIEQGQQAREQFKVLLD